MRQGKPSSLSGLAHEALDTDRGMAAYLDHHVGRDGWAYDAICDVWVVPADFTDAPGDRRFVIFERGGCCTYAIIPARWLQ